MSWRTVVISNNAKLDYQLGYLVVRGQETKKIHLNEIRTLIIESTAVSFTSYLLCELVKNKIKVIFCDEKRSPISELLPYYGSHNTSMKIRNQIQWRKEKKTSVWTQIVTEKILQQALLLQDLQMPEAQMLFRYIDEMEPGDMTNREGHAAKVYFNALFGKNFSRAEEHPINAALNYGYSILLSMFNREITANGYLTQLGLFHDNMFNPFNLSSDLMEPFRPVVDWKVWNMQPGTFEKDEKHELLQITCQELTVAGKKEVLDNAVKIYVKSVFDVLETDEEMDIRFYRR